MASVELRPGDTLSIIWSSVQDTPLGKKEVESSFAFSYDDLLVRLRSKGRAGKSRRSGTEGARFSRVVALSTHALQKGKWSTGADISRADVFSKFMIRFNSLHEKEYKNITQNATESLVELYQKKGLLSKAQSDELGQVLTKLGLPT